MTSEVILRDFDGSRTVYPTSFPLKEVIHRIEQEFGIEVGKIYVRTTETDAYGRIIYAEQR